MKRALFYTILGVVVLLFTNCEPKINFNTGNNLLYWGYNVDAQYDKLAYYGFVGGDRFDCMYEDSWSLKIYQVIVKKKNLYLYTRDTIPSLGKCKNVLRKNGKIVRDDLPIGTLVLNNKEIRVYSKNLSLAPSETYKSTVWIDGEMHDLKLEEPKVDVVIYYPVITDAVNDGKDFYYLGFCPSANGIVAAGWKNESLIFNSNDTIKPNGVLPKGMVVDNDACYWLFTKGRQVVLYKNNEIIRYFDDEWLDYDESLRYVPFGMYQDGDDVYYALNKLDNNSDLMSRYTIVVYKGDEMVLSINGYTKGVVVNNGVVYSLIGRGTTSVFYENDRQIYAISQDKTECEGIVYFGD